MILNKYLRKGLRAGKLGLITGLSAFLINCENILGPKDKYEDYIPRVISEQKVAKDLERPGGLSTYEVPSKNLQKTIESKLININSIFTTGPIIPDTTWRNFIQKPKVYQISGTIEEIINGSSNINILAEFSDKYSHDFFSGVYTGIITDKDGDGVDDTPGDCRPVGLTLDALLLDNEILFSSSPSNKLFKVDSLGNINIFLEDNELEGITDMILGSDGKIYAIQSPDVSTIDSTIVRPKRVISIDSLKNINTEFEISSEYHGNLLRGWGIADEQLKIIENSPIGKERFEYDFYISDLLANKIYGIKDGVSEVLIDNVKYPSSLRVGALGNIFYTTSPLWDSEYDEHGLTNLDYPTELHFYRPKTGDDYLMHSFDERSIWEYASSGIYQNVEYNGKTYVLPTGFNVSSILSETEDKLKFLFTNSHQGELKSIVADKF